MKKPFQTVARRVRQLKNPGPVVKAVRYHVGQAWSEWKRATARKKKHRIFCAWLSHLRSSPPDVLIGANYANQGGVCHHIRAIRRYSALRVELAPSDKLLGSLALKDLQNELKQPFMDFAPTGIRAIHSHVFPSFIEWCRKHQDSGARWVHTYHLLYFPEHAKDGLLPWQKKVNESLVNDARHADVRISVSRWQQRYLQENHGIETIYIPNGADAALCERADGQRFVRRTGMSGFILYAGRNDPVKNPADFVRLAQRLPNQEFVMVGPGLTREVLGTEWSVDVPANLYLYGPATHTETQDAIAACSALVVTSKREGLPTLVLEAMAQSKPVVVPDEPGCMEAVGHGEFGSIYRQDDLNDLAEKTLTVLADTQRNQGARQRVLSEYDWRVVIPQLDAIYQGQT